MASPLRRWLVAFGAVALFCLVSALFFDRALGAFIAAHPKPQRLLDLSLSAVVVVLMPVGAAAFAWCGLAALAGKKPSPPLERAGLAGLAMLWALAVNDFIFKFAFGRANIGAVLGGGGPGWAPFHGSVESSFPSGHMVIVTAFSCVLWIIQPRYRILYAILIVAVALDLLIADWHFLSDIVAGFFTGALAGAMTVAWWRRR